MASRLVAAFAMGFVLTLGASLQELPATAIRALSVEAPTSLFASSQGRSEIFASGSWDLSLLSSVEATIPPGQGLTLGQVQPLLFRQTPDLILSFLYDRHWFVDAKVSPDAAASRFALGYRGLEGDTLSELRIGTTGIGLKDLPYVAIGTGGLGSFGAMVTAEGGGIRTASLLRYDQAERVSKTWLGGGESTETLVAPAAYIRGRWFVLPSGSVSSLSVYAESLLGGLLDSGGSHWRRLSRDEYRITEAGTLLALDSRAESRIALSWNGLTLADLSIDSMPSMVVYDAAQAPGHLEFLARYAGQSSSDELYVRNRASGRRDSRFMVVAEEGTTMRVESLADALPDPRPFESLVPDLYTRLPTEAGGSFSSFDGFEIVCLARSAGGEMTVDKDALLASIEVLRNGVPDQAFDVDAAKGSISLRRRIDPTETITVSWLRQSSERKAGALTGGLVGQFDLGPGSDAWTALYGHLGIPGSGFAEGGGSDPAKLSLALGIRKVGGKLEYSAGGQARAGTRESTGRFRIEGFEAAGSYSTSFYPEGGSLPQGFSLSETPMPDFDSAWPESSAILHPGGAVSKSLRIETSCGGSIALYKIVSRPPLEAFNYLDMYLSVHSGGNQGGSLSLSLDTGSGGSTALSLEIPLSALGQGWTRVRLRYGGPLATSIQVGESGPVLSLSGAVAAVDPLVVDACRLVLALHGLPAGAVIGIDELTLVEARPDASLEASAALSWRDASASLAPFGLALLTGLDSRLSFAGGMASALVPGLGSSLAYSSWIDSDLSLGTQLGPLGVKAGLRGMADSSGLGFRGWHELGFEVKELPLSLGDRFSWDPVTGALSRRDWAALAASPWVAANAEASATRDLADSGGAGSLARLWIAKAGLFSLVDAKLEVSENSDAIAAIQAGTYASTWKESLVWYLPESRGIVVARRIAAEAGLGLGSGTRLLSLVATSASALTAVPFRKDELRLRFELPLPSVLGWTVTPWYQRYFSDQRSGSDATLLGFASGGWKLLETLRLPWTALPFAEFSKKSLGPDLSSLAARSALDMPAYVPEAGISLLREPGLSPFELLIPTAVGFSFNRQLSSDGIALRDLSTLKSKLGFSAIELYGSRGAYPVFKRYASDEYQLDLAASLEIPRSGSFNTWSVDESALTALLGGREAVGERIVANQSASFSADPGGYSWAAKAGCDFSTRPPDSPLLAVWRLVSPQIAPGLSSTGTALDSAWLRSLGSLQPRAVETLGIDAGLKGSRRDGALPLPEITLSESWETRISVPDRFAAFGKLKFAEGRDGAGTLHLSAEASLGCTLSF
ncbi:MAG: hypothetical protein WCQ50_17260 [Spirochaetota bacterium]